MSNINKNSICGSQGRARPVGGGRLQFDLLTKQGVSSNEYVPLNRSPVVATSPVRHRNVEDIESDRA